MSPAPVPPEVDLRDFPYMPVDIARLFGSEFHARSNDAAWRAGLTLWLKSYHQVPAASIPDDDVSQARLAELGRDVRAWRKIKEEALRGWIKCDDGRLYHPVVAEKALEAWLEKLGQRKSSAAGNAKRYSQPFDPSPFDASIEAARGRLAAINQNSRFLTKGLPRQSRQPPAGSPDNLPSGSQEKGREEKRREESNNPPPPSTIPESEKGEGEGDFNIFFERFPKGPLASRPKALIAWRETPVEERVLALAGLGRFAASKQNTSNPVSPHTYLIDKMFLNFSTNGSVRPNLIQIEKLSPEGVAWEAHSRKTKGKGLPWTNGKWSVPSRFPPIEEQTLAG